MNISWTLALLFLLTLIMLTKTKNLLSLIILLETLTLTALLVSFFILITFTYGPFLILGVFTLSVCEAALGLSLMISYFSTSGNDSFSNFGGGGWT
uniref:NADH dehydrogenase subunit 4L n=1 Tax=Discus perspectivus TaxID=697275 RepID=UPI0021769E96|nr:NADH dehydrogenase subunit 4L [Discus perspectivus]UUB71739.1 NADH dehydrogenase subunit 4L [Discus perspectivus]